MDIPRSRRRVMEVMYQEFARSGNWPLTDWVDDELRGEVGDDGRPINAWHEVRSGTRPRIERRLGGLTRAEPRVVASRVELVGWGDGSSWLVNAQKDDS